MDCQRHKLKREPVNDISNKNASTTTSFLKPKDDRTRRVDDRLALDRTKRFGKRRSQDGSQTYNLKISPRKAKKRKRWKGYEELKEMYGEENIPADP